MFSAKLKLRIDVSNIVAFLLTSQIHVHYPVATVRSTQIKFVRNMALHLKRERYDTDDSVFLYFCDKTVSGMFEIQYILSYTLQFDLGFWKSPICGRGAIDRPQKETT